jgi:hypothetical protein
MIPDFREDRIAFLRFVKSNKYIFDILLNSGRYHVTRGFNKRYVEEAYKFMINVDVDDDANMGAFLYDLDDFTVDEDPGDMEEMVNEFVRWTENATTQTNFRKESNKLLEPAIKSRVESMNERRKTMKRVNERTGRIKEELLRVEYEPDDRKHSVRGKTYRKYRDKWYTNLNVGGKKRKTHKKRGKNHACRLDISK